MKVPLLLLHALCGLSVYLASAQNCSNPFFANFQIAATAGISVPGVSGAVTINVQGQTPSTLPANPVACKAFAGQQACCSAGGTLSSVVNANLVAQALLNSTKTTLSLAAKAFQLSAATYFADCTIVTSGLSASTCTAIQVNTTALGTIASQFAVDAGTCATALQVYLDGMFCFSCSPQWSSFAASGTANINIHTNTLHNIVTNCAPLNADLVNLLQTLASMMIALSKSNVVNALGGATTFSAQASATLALSDYCGGTVAQPGNCATFIGANWLAGTNVFLSGSASASAARRLTIDTPDAKLNKLLESARDLINLGSKNSGRSLGAASSSSTTNTYSSNGYDATSVGCSDNPGASTCPASATTTTVSTGTTSAGAATTTPAATQSCANPLFANFQLAATAGVSVPGVTGTVTINVQGQTPATLPANPVACKALVGQQACCSAGVLVSISNAHKVVAALLTASQAAVSNTIQTSIGGASAYATDCTAAMAAGVSAATCAAIEVNATKLSNLASQLNADSAACAAALQVYLDGMFCFSCSTQWNTYVDSVAATVNIHTNTINNIRSNCAPVNADIVAILRTVAGMATTLAQATVNVVTSAQLNAAASASLAISDYCGGTAANPGDCNSYIGAHWVAGTNVYFAGSVSLGARRRVLIESALLDDEPTTVYFRSLISSSLDLVEKLDTIHSSDAGNQNGRILTSSTYSNTYSSNGYDANSVGCGDNAGSSACSSTSTTAQPHTNGGPAMKAVTTTLMVAVVLPIVLLF